jgi:hypothetical protein
MSHTKKQEPLLEEEKDFYLSFVNKKIRNTKKKLEQIDELMKKDPETLKPEQREKVDARDEVLQTIKYHEELKSLYYTAYKTSLEEGKATPKSKTSEKKSKTETQDPVEEALKRLLELFAFSQLVGNSSQNFGQDLPINQLKQFCNSNLNFTSPSSLTIEERVQQSLNLIKPYIQAEGEFELEGEKYSNLHESIHQALQQPLTVVTKEENTTPTSHKSNEIGLPPSAVTLQNPVVESTQKPHKVVRFVDEIEKDLMSDKNKESSPALESENPTPTETRQPEEEREQSGEEQEQKSFRKRRNYDNQDKPKGTYNNNGAKNHRGQDNYHRGGGRNSGSKYQYTTTYYEKKSSENKN